MIGTSQTMDRQREIVIHCGKKVGVMNEGTVVGSGRDALVA